MTYLPVYYGSAIPSSPACYPATLIPGDSRNPAADPAYQAYLASLYSSPLVWGRVLEPDSDDIILTP